MTNKYYCYGFHPIRTLLAQQPERVITVFIQQGRKDKRVQQLQQICEQQGISLQFCKESRLDSFANQNTHQGFVAQVKAKTQLNEQALDKIVAEKSAPFILVLVGVQDPHNLGAILRTAEAVSVDCVVIPKHKSAGLTPAVTKASAGASELIPLVEVVNINRTLKQLSELGVRCMATAPQEAERLYDCDLTGPVALVMGAEGEGLKPSHIENCDSCIEIPMQGRVESLNVSVAAGVCLYEALRQRTKS